MRTGSVGMKRAVATTATAILLIGSGASQAAADTLTLLWDPSPSANAAGYVVQVGTKAGQYAASYDVGSVTSFSYFSAVPGQMYYFAIGAYDSNHTLGPLSAEVKGYSNASGSFQAAPDSLTLLWDPSPSVNAAGYAVLVGTQSGKYAESYDVGSATSFSYFSAVPGQMYYFAVGAYDSNHTLGPLSGEIGGYSNAPPVLQNPGPQASTVGQSTSLQLVGSDPYGQPITYSASGLPPGLSIVSSAGFISGTPTVAGSYNVMASVSDGVLSNAQSFIWNTTVTDTADVISPVVTITDPKWSESISDSPYSTLVGTATDDTGEITEVTWSTDRGQSGRASGTNAWIANIPLKPGWNTVTVNARDRAGNVGRGSLKIRSRK